MRVGRSVLLLVPLSKQPRAKMIFGYSIRCNIATFIYIIHYLSNCKFKDLVNSLGGKYFSLWANQLNSGGKCNLKTV